MLFRFPGVGASYNDAVTNCEAKSGSLLNVEDIKFIDVNFVKSKAKLSIFRIDAKKGSMNHNLLYFNRATLRCNPTMSEKKKFFANCSFGFLLNLEYCAVNQNEFFYSINIRFKWSMED